MQTFIPMEEMIFETVEQDKLLLRQFLNKFEEKEWKFDLSKVNLCDSAGVALLIEAKRLSKHKNIKCHFHGVSDSMQSLIRFCGVEKILFANN